VKKCLLIILSLWFVSTGQVFSQEDTLDVFYNHDETRGHDLALFESDDVLDMTLRFDITAFRRLRSDTTELNAVLTIHLSETDSIDKNIKVRARGYMRRSYCDMPPIRLNFKKSGSPGDEFRDVDKIKLVTHCKVGNEEYLLKEFLAYRLYNVLTEYSYRVRLARILYINTSAKKSKPIEEFAFLIEPNDALCKRLNIIEVPDTKISQRLVRPEVMDRMALFCYMIGNPDWSLPIRHNVLFFVPNEIGQNSQGLVIPYDFDYAGMVNADYAIPFEGLGIKTVLERIYLGMCRDREVFIRGLKEFSANRENFYRVINEFPYLKEKSKKRVINYLNEFLLNIDKGSSVINKIEHDCIDL
jgi:hypothetical protein